MTAGTYVVEMTGHNLVTDEEVTLRFAQGEGIAFSDEEYAYGGLMKWACPTQKIEVDKGGMVTSKIDVGELIINNAPTHISLPGDWDSIADYVWHRRTATVYWVPGTAWSAKVFCFRGQLEQPVANLSVSGSGYDSTLRFPLRDMRSDLETPLHAKSTDRYGGTNSGGNGVDGEADLKGRVRPVIYGTVSNKRPDEVNRGKKIYCCADKAVTVHCVRDGALKVSPGTSRANVASLEANIPTPGTYDYTSTASGTYIRMGTRPSAVLTVDLLEGANDAERTHAQVWKRFRTERCGTSSGDINAAAVAAIDALDANEVGFCFDEEITRRAAIDRILGSLSGYEVLNGDDEWVIGKLLVASGDPALKLVLQQQGTQLGLLDRPIVKLTLVRPSYMPDGSPPYRVVVRWGKNHAVMGDRDFNGLALTNSAYRRLVDKFKVEWRTEVAKDDTIWNPDASTGDFVGAPELIIETGYQPDSSGETSSHSLDEAERIRDLYGARPRQVQVDFVAQPGDEFLPGMIVQVTYPGYDLDAGKIFRVMQASTVIQNTSEGPRALASMILGMEADA